MEPKPKMLWVRWRDASSYRGWRSKEGCTTLHVETLGWLVEETKEHLMLAMDRATGEEDALPWAEIEVIPKGMVLEKKVVKWVT